jgi:hypothetical protein
MELLQHVTTVLSRVPPRILATPVHVTHHLVNVCQAPFVKRRIMATSVPHWTLLLAVAPVDARTTLSLALKIRTPASTLRVNHPPDAPIQLFVPSTIHPATSVLLLIIHFVLTNALTRPLCARNPPTHAHTVIVSQTQALALIRYKFVILVTLVCNGTIRLAHKDIAHTLITHVITQTPGPLQHVPTAAIMSPTVKTQHFAPLIKRSMVKLTSVSSSVAELMEFVNTPTLLAHQQM